MRCVECGSNSIFTDFKRGEVVCRKCGLVLKEYMFDIQLPRPDFDGYGSAYSGKQKIFKKTKESGKQRKKRYHLNEMFYLVEDLLYGARSSDKLTEEEMELLDNIKTELNEKIERLYTKEKWISGRGIRLEDVPFTLLYFLLLAKEFEEVRKVIVPSKYSNIVEFLESEYPAQVEIAMKNHKLFFNKALKDLKRKDIVVDGYVRYKDDIDPNWSRFNEKTCHSLIEFPGANEKKEQIVKTISTGGILLFIDFFYTLSPKDKKKHRGKKGLLCACLYYASTRACYRYKEAHRMLGQGDMTVSTKDKKTWCKYFEIDENTLYRRLKEIEQTINSGRINPVLYI